MEEVLFIDWGKDETTVRPVRLIGDGFVQDARFEHPYKLTGERERQIFEVATLIEHIRPDRVASDRCGINACLGNMLRDTLDRMGRNKANANSVP